MKGPQTGIKCEKFINVRREHLANEVGSGDVPVFSTPMAVNAMESAASELLREYLNPGMVSVGTNINIDHVAPTLEGVSVKITAELISIEGRKYKFYVEAYDNAGIIAKGAHERIVLDEEKFLKKALERSKTVV